MHHFYSVLYVCLMVLEAMVTGALKMFGFFLPNANHSHRSSVLAVFWWFRLCSYCLIVITSLLAISLNSIWSCFVRLTFLPLYSKTENRYILYVSHAILACSKRQGQKQQVSWEERETSIVISVSNLVAPWWETVMVASIGSTEVETKPPQNSVGPSFALTSLWEACGKWLDYNFCEYLFKELFNFKSGWQVGREKLDLGHYVAFHLRIFNYLAALLP